MIVVIPLVALLLGLVPGLFLGRAGQVWPIAVLALVFLAGIGWAILQGRAATDGWDGIGYAILAFLMLAPVVLGLTLGGLAGLLWRRRLIRSAQDRGGQDGGGQDRGGQGGDGDDV